MGFRNSSRDWLKGVIRTTIIRRLASKVCLANPRIVGKGR
jgi:hypothetical protein